MSCQGFFPGTRNLRGDTWYWLTLTFSTLFNGEATRGFPTDCTVNPNPEPRLERALCTSPARLVILRSYRNGKSLRLIR